MIRTLYAVAVIHLRKKHSKFHVIHLHAESIDHARRQFCKTYPNRRTHQIVEVGPVVGFFVDDEHGEKLSA